MSLEWNKIRTWNGSTANAFEELVCQLAFCDPIPANSRFVRKGAPDAGIECFWCLESGEEYGWQAKFFTSVPSPSQWSQVDASVRTALKKHTRLTKYTVAMPIDRSDARIDGKKSCLDNWNEHVEKWEKLAIENGMSVTFNFWGTHEISEKLSRDEHKGRHYFWFNEVQFSPIWFQHRLDESIATVGPRYTPELNIHLPIMEIFNGLSRNQDFYHDFEQAYGQIGKALSNGSLKEIESDLPEQIALFTQRLIRIIDLSKNYCVFGVNTINWANLQDKILKLISMISDIQQLVSDLANTQIESKKAKGEKEKHYHGQEPFGLARRTLYHIMDKLDGFYSFTESDVAKLANMPFLLLVGSAGTGKTHLLSDAARQHVASGAPAVLLIGSQFRDEELWTQILRILGLSCTRDEFLGALEASAQMAGRRAVIFIDALNEGDGRRAWTKHLPAMLANIRRYPWVALALSVRTSYEKLVISDDLVPEKMTRSMHLGFADMEYQAAKNYFNYYGIELPSVPILAPEFQNPLFLKCFCKGLHSRGLTKIPTGIHGITSVFNFFLDSVNEKLASPECLDYDSKTNLVQQAASQFAAIASASASPMITRAEARSICDELLPSRSYEQSLLRHLLSEGVLAESVRYDEHGQHEDVIIFSYERLADHLIMRQLIAKHVNANDPANSFNVGQPMGKLFANVHACKLNQGLAEALAIQAPEILGVEIFALVPDVMSVHPICEAFIESLLWRDPVTISDHCLEYINNQILPNKYLYGKLLNTVLAIAPNPLHPYNADFLHHNLMRLELAERDACWSIFLYDEYGNKNSVDRLVDWACSDADKSHIAKDSIRLVGKALLWFLTTSQRFLRDRATKALVALFTDRIDILCQLLSEFDEVNDPYVSERLYAVAYGCALRSNDIASKSKLATAVYKLVFQDGTPPCHILLRDYARGVIEVAIKDGLSVEGLDVEKIRPPYRSEWPLEIPTEAEVEMYGKWYKDMPREQWSLHDIYGSVMNHGDFGRYILGSDMGSLHWSKRRLDEPRVSSRKEQYDAFEESLTARQRSAWDAYLKARGAEEIYYRLKTDERKKNFDRELKKEELQGAVNHRLLKLFRALGKKKTSVLNNVVLPYLDASPAEKDEFALPVSIAQRWIIKRVIDLGWNVERFGRFDRYDREYAGAGRSAHKPERIGKKYQWLAYHEMLAHLADNLEYRENTWSQKSEEYVGPWQLSLRDIDPSCLLRSTQSNNFEPHQPAWWAPVKFEDWSVESDEALWRKSIDLLPAIASLPIVTNPETGKEWFVLQCFYDWEEPVPPEEDRFNVQRRYVWYMLKSYLIKAENEQCFYEWGLNQHFMGRWMPESNGHTHSFLGEYCWSPAFNNFDNAYYSRGGWTRGLLREIPCEVLVSADEYIQENTSYDCSNNDSFAIYLPAKWIVDHMNLSWRGVDGSYFNTKGELGAQDPSVKSPGPRALLFDRDILSTFLRDNGYRLLWTLLGEKDIRGPLGNHDNWPGRMELSCCMRMRNEQLEGSATAYWVTRGPRRAELGRLRIHHEY